MDLGALRRWRKANSSTGMQIQVQVRLPLLLLGIVGLTAVFLPDRVWNTILIGMGGLFLLAFGWTASLARNLRVSRSLRFGWVAIGDRLSETFTLENRGIIPALWVEINDDSTVPGYDASIVQSVGGQTAINWRRSAICLRRGHYLLGPWTVRCGDPFGIFSATRHYADSTEIIIHPPTHGNLPIPLPPGQTGGSARARQRARQATLNAASVRQYQPSDPYRWIHWRQSAHQDKLMVREFDLDAAGDFWLVLDMEKSVQLGEGTEGTEEHAVLLAAAMAAQAIRHVRKTGLLVYSQQPDVVHPGVGQGHMWQILRTLALLKADGDVVLSLALRDVARIAAAGSTAVIITANGSSEWLPSLLAVARQGIHAQLVLLDRPSFGGAGSSTSLRDALHQLGFAAQIIHQGEVGVPLVEQKKRGHWQFQVTPLGGVITVHNPLEDAGR